MGGSPCRMSNLRNGMSPVSVANKSLCPLSNLRNGNVACHYRFTPSCHVTKAPCRMSNLRNGNVAVSNLVVQTHTIGPATRCDHAHLRWGVQKLLQCRNITCDPLRCKFQHVQYFAPDYGISQPIIIQILKGL